MIASGDLVDGKPVSSCLMLAPLAEVFALALITVFPAAIDNLGLLAQDARMAAALRAQDHLYTLIEKGNGEPSAAVIGSIVGTVIGALIISVLNNGLQIMSIPQEWQNVILGCVILLARSSIASRRRTRPPRSRKPG